MEKIKQLITPDNQKISYQHYCAKHRKPLGILFCGGFKSDMLEVKSQAFAEWARKNDYDYCCFDYFGHGQSSGEFAEGNISRWLADTLLILDQICQGPQLVIGSSMGVWIALLVALARTKKVAAIMGIAGAADFTEDIIWSKATPEILAHIQEHGVYHHQADDEGQEEPFAITMQLLEDGRKHLLLRDTIRLSIPVHLIHGLEDLDVPWETSLAIMQQIASHHVTLQLIKEGDHRLSNDRHIEMLIQELELFITRIG